MRKRIILIDATKVIIEELDKAFSEIIPNAEILHMVDESIIQLENVPGKQLIRRFCNLVVSAEEAGADVIVLTCASSIPSAHIVQMLVDTPVVQITEPMIEVAVERGKKVGLIATEKAIVEPIVELFQKISEQKKKKILVKVDLCEEAIKARLSGNTAKHDELVIKKIIEVSKIADVIVLAQVSMARVVPQIERKINRLVLSPPRIAAEKIKAMLYA